MTGPIVPRGFKDECGDRAAHAIVDENFGPARNRRWHIWLTWWLRRCDELGVTAFGEAA